MAAPAPLALDWNVLEPHLRRVVDLINTAAAAAANVQQITNRLDALEGRFGTLVDQLAAVEERLGVLAGIHQQQVQRPSRLPKVIRDANARATFQSPLVYPAWAEEFLVELPRLKGDAASISCERASALLDMLGIQVEPDATVQEKKVAFLYWIGIL